MLNSGSTEVTAVAVLLLEFNSITLREDTVAVLVTGPTTVVPAMMVTVAWAALVIKPNSQRMVPLLLLQLPWLLVAETKVNPDGNESVSRASGTGSGPAFVTVSV
jgi:hypothetical protein